MNKRNERAARNEAMFRTVNRELEQATREAGGGPGDQLEVLCECGDEGCSAMVTLTLSEYEEIHRQPDRFVVLPGHENPEIERVMARKDRYLVVDKFGEAEEIVEEDAERQEGSE
jgi:hypothetical protein